MPKYIFFTLPAFLVLFCFAPGAFAEPSAKEMKSALQDKIDEINAEYGELGRRCERREFKNDPLLAMQCLQLCSAGAGKCSLTIQMTHFEKLYCGYAIAEGVYRCNYIMGLSSDSPFMQGLIGQALGAGNEGSARFMNRGGKWTFLPNQ